MRLPHLKSALDTTRNEDEITLLVQSEIIRSIYEPDPSEENCPGELKDGNCYQTRIGLTKFGNYTGVCTNLGCSIAYFSRS